MNALQKVSLIVLAVAPSVLAQEVESGVGGVVERQGLVGFTQLDFGSADSALRRTLWRPFDPSSIAVQAVVGVGLSAAVIIPSVGLLKKTEGLGELGLLVGFSFVAEVVIPLVEYSAGELMGGDGSYGMTLVSSLVGGGMGLLPAIISGRGNGEEVFPIAVIGATLGAIVGYHLFASPVYATEGSAPVHSYLPGGSVRVTVVSVRF